mmetsp:Transcript_45382/g.125948  ORF Transcript_45382/g.125948 Transcript_45382/m.125948 type:complete len:234 (-) Transcript_45382:241-942(-)
MRSSSSIDASSPNRSRTSFAKLGRGRKCCQDIWIWSCWTSSTCAPKTFGAAAREYIAMDCGDGRPSPAAVTALMVHWYIRSGERPCTETTKDQVKSSKSSQSITSGHLDFGRIASSLEAALPGPCWVSFSNSSPNGSTPDCHAAASPAAFARPTHMVLTSALGAPAGFTCTTKSRTSSSWTAPFVISSHCGSKSQPSTNAVCVLKRSRGWLGVGATRQVVTRSLCFDHGPWPI